MSYNIHINIPIYTTNKEYRQCIRSAFYMEDQDLEDQYEDLDEESADELNFDMDRAETVMQELYLLTKEDPVFQELYDLAAATMLSEDRQIGQSVLFSYDYFRLFHNCLRYFFVITTTSSNESYSRLRVTPSSVNNACSMDENARCFQQLKLLLTR